MTRKTAKPAAPKRTAEQQAATMAERMKREADRKRLVMTGLRDIAPIPAVFNPERRAACASSLRLFCETYFPAQFSLAWSDDHLRVIAKIETAVLVGGLFALAMPRGSGKSTLAECSATWSTLYGHRMYPVVIGSDEAAAASMLDSVKTELETNDLLLEDFPEVCYPIRCLGGIAHRAAGQLCGGVSTRIGWTAKELVFPTIAGSRASGAVLQVTGITGRIRGMAYKRADGRKMRPDFVIIDDPQTDESAKSPSQCQARLGVLTGAVLGLAGPSKKIAGVMPCTVIQPGDMADRILDPQEHPEWNGERTKLVYTWPTNAKLWEDYARIRADALREGKGIAPATAFYVEHQAAMDAGARVAWPERFNPDEASALQNAMNLRLQDEAAFFAEYQNEPMAAQSESDESLTADIVASRVSGVDRGVVPSWATRLTAMADVSQRVLWWTVVAWDDECRGHVVDYGAYPDQNRDYFTLRDARIGLADVIKGAGLEGQIAGGLDALTSDLFGRRFPTVAGGEMRIDRMLIDSNWGQSTDVVYDFCRRSPFSAMLLPSHGRGITAASKPMSEWKREKGEQVGLNWRIAKKTRGLRAVTYDTNIFKSFIAARLLTAPGDVGAMSLWGKEPHRHRMFGDQVAAEYRVRTGGRGRSLDEWRLRPGQDNHWLDCLVGCAVAASIGGMPPAPPRRVLAPGTKVDAPTSGKSDRMSFAALQRAAREKKRA